MPDEIPPPDTHPSLFVDSPKRYDIGCVNLDESAGQEGNLLEAKTGCTGAEEPKQAVFAVVFRRSDVSLCCLVHSQTEKNGPEHVAREIRVARAGDAQ